MNEELYESMDVRELDDYHGWFLHYHRERGNAETWTVNWLLQSGAMVLHDYEHWRKEPPAYQYRDEKTLDDDAREIIANVLQRPNLNDEVNRMIDAHERVVCGIAKRMAKKARMPTKKATT